MRVVWESGWFRVSDFKLLGFRALGFGSVFHKLRRVLGVMA